jgi:hypothetical protein
MTRRADAALLSRTLRGKDDCLHIAAYAAVPSRQYRTLLEFDEQGVHDRKIVLAGMGGQIVGYRQCDGWQAYLSVQGLELVFHPMRIADQSYRLAMNMEIPERGQMMCPRVHRSRFHRLVKFTQSDWPRFFVGSLWKPIKKAR